MLFGFFESGIICCQESWKSISGEKLARHQKRKNFLNRSDSGGRNNQAPANAFSYLESRE
jgi:hypothetical protein